MSCSKDGLAELNRNKLYALIESTYAEMLIEKSTLTEAFVHEYDKMNIYLVEIFMVQSEKQMPLSIYHILVNKETLLV